MREIETLGLDGAFVEVGVAAGHASVIAALATSRHFKRDFYLFDTFTGYGNPPPDERDQDGISFRDCDLSHYREQDCTKPVVEGWMRQTGISSENLLILQGFAQATTVSIKPSKIAILKLDVGLSVPTLSAMSNLFDSLQVGGYLIVDGYGKWRGCKKAIDQFFSERDMVFDGIALDEECYILRK